MAADADGPLEADDLQAVLVRPPGGIALALRHALGQLAHPVERAVENGRDIEGMGEEDQKRRMKNQE